MNVGTNQLLGLNNPYLNEAISRSQGDTSRQYQQTILPEMLRLQHASGAFGNSGLQQYQQESQRQLAQELGRIANEARMSDYNLQAQLGEADVNRKAQYQQADIARNAGLSESDIARKYAAQLEDLNRNSNLSEADIARKAQYAANDLARNAGIGENSLDRQAQAAQAAAQNRIAEAQNQIAAANLAVTLGQQDYNDIQKLLGAGDILQAQTNAQLGEQYNNWSNKQNYPYAQLDVLGNALSRTMGAGGTTTSTSTNPSYSPSNTASAIGGGLAGYGLASSASPATNIGQFFNSNPLAGAALGATAGYFL